MIHHPECPAEQLSGLAYADPSRFCECEPCGCEDGTACVIVGMYDDDEYDYHVIACPDCEGTKRRLVDGPLEAA